MSDERRLQSYVDAWAEAVDDVVALLRSLEPDDWQRPTDLAGWDVRAVAAHLAHLESELAGHPQEEVDVPEAPHIVSFMGAYTEQGPIARRGWTTDQVVDELETATAARLQSLRQDPPTDGKGDPPVTPGGIGWSWETLLSNRVVDMWMHDQDVRRAVGRPGALDGLAARHVLEVFARGLGFVVGKRVGATPGTSVRLVVTGEQQVDTTVEVGDDGRARTADVSDPGVTLLMPFEDFVVLAGGRCEPSSVRVEGDQELGAAVLAAMAVTP